MVTKSGYRLLGHLSGGYIKNIYFDAFILKWYILLKL